MNAASPLVLPTVPDDIRADASTDRSADIRAHASTDTSVFDRVESNVRSYCRSFPTVFRRAKGSIVEGADGTRYIDFFAGAGALNFGHNHERIKRAVIEYLSDDGIVHGLDLHTSAKAAFLETFEARVLAPRALDYKLQFTGPTGTNAVEAALKVGRKATGRTNVISFMGGYHGHSLGALAATANRDHRAAAGVPLAHTTMAPFPFGFMAGIDTIGYLEAVLDDTHSGIDTPAAVIVETVQAEGGIVPAPTEWLRRLRRLCTERGIVLIVDDIQVGCGRTGPFFSFEWAGITPDIVTLSKSISGYGLPMSLVLIRPELDVWKPAEHTGTFRGNQAAFVAATAALDVFEDEKLEVATLENATFLDRRLAAMGALHEGIGHRGVGMIWGLDLTAVDPSGAFARDVSRTCFERGLIIERVGRNDTVLKLLPPLTIERPLLAEGCDVIEGAVRDCLAGNRPA